MTAITLIAIVPGFRWRIWSRLPKTTCGSLKHAQVGTSGVVAVMRLPVTRGAVTPIDNADLGEHAVEIPGCVLDPCACSSWKQLRNLHVTEGILAQDLQKHILPGLEREECLGAIGVVHE